MLIIVATTFVGALGGEVEIDDDSLDEADIPPEFVAVTENVYEVLDDKPDTVIGEVRFVPVKPPVLLVTV